jgi:hypothetical protein
MNSGYLTQNYFTDYSLSQLDHGQQPCCCLHLQLSATTDAQFSQIQFHCSELAKYLYVFAFLSPNTSILEAFALLSLVQAD